MANLNTQTSIVDYLKSVGQPSDFDSRQALASKYGITNYQGTAEQNVKLLNLLKTPSVFLSPTTAGSPSPGNVTPPNIPQPPSTTANVNQPATPTSGISSGSMVNYDQLLADTQKLFENRQNIIQTTQGLLSDFVRQQQEQIEAQKQALRAQIEAQYSQQIAGLQQQEKGVTSDTEAQLAKLRPYAGISTAADNYKASVKAEFQKAYQQADALRQQAIANLDYQAAQRIADLQQKLLENHLNTLSRIDEVQTQALQAYANILTTKQASEVQQKQLSLQEKQLRINAITPQISAILTTLKGKGFDSLDSTTKTQLETLSKELERAMDLPEGSLFAAYKQIINDPQKNITSYLNQQTGELVTLAVSPDGKIEMVDKKKIFDVGPLSSDDSKSLAVQQIVKKQVENFYNAASSKEISVLADTIKKNYGIDITPAQVNQIFSLKSNPDEAKKFIISLLPKTSLTSFEAPEALKSLGSKVASGTFELPTSDESLKSLIYGLSKTPTDNRFPQLNPQNLADDIYSTIISSAPNIKKNIDSQKTLEYVGREIFGRVNDLLINNGIPVDEKSLKAIAYAIYDVLPQDLGSIEPSKLSGDALYAYSLLRKYLYLPTTSQNTPIFQIIPELNTSSGQ